MPKKTVSLSENLAAQLNHYAAAHYLPVSHVVQQALEQFMGGTLAATQSPSPAQVTPPMPPGPDPHLAIDIHQLQDYVAGLASYVDGLRGYLSQNTQMWNQPPQPFPPPPWWRG